MLMKWFCSLLSKKKIIYAHVKKKTIEVPSLYFMKLM